MLMNYENTGLWLISEQRERERGEMTHTYAHTLTFRGRGWAWVRAWLFVIISEESLAAEETYQNNDSVRGVCVGCWGGGGEGEHFAS